MSEQTHAPSTVPLAEDTRRATGSVQWLLSSQEDKDTPIRYANELKVFICGEEAFVQIAQDIENARASVEIICWGFDPAMELVRTGNEWPRGITWGGLLRKVADGQGRSGQRVQVRVLSWNGFIGSDLAGNMPGFRQTPDAAVERYGSESPRAQRELFNATWYRDAFGNRIDKLSIRIRDGDGSAVRKSLRGELDRRGLIEEAGMLLLPTDHQKTILIDYEHEGGIHAVGYVMGLNSVTDYWDTRKHLFDDPRRGQWWEGAKDSHPSLKPYQDYACRVRGAALVDVSKNFTAAWNRASGNGEPMGRTHNLQHPPAGLVQGLERWSPKRSAQILCTLPEEQQKKIKRLYWQASSFARNYLYVENQYFQYTPWAEHLKSERKKYCDLWAEACKTSAKPPELHAFIVIPTPERGQMVPRTHDVVKSLGHGDSMPNQDKQIDDEIDRYHKANAVYDKYPGMFPRRAELSDLASESMALGSKADIKRQLDALGLRTLVASLWSFDEDYRTRQKKELATLKEWEDSATRDAQGKDISPNKDFTQALRNKLFPQRYREIYIHSKLMIIDDSMFTLGSANLNQRSMAVDTEINLASDDAPMARRLRRDVWGMLTGGAEDCNPEGVESKVIVKAFNEWKKLLEANKNTQDRGNKPKGFLMPFHDGRTSSIRLG